MLIQSPGTVVEEGVFVSPGIHVSLDDNSVLKKGTRIVLAEGSYNEGRKPVSLTIQGTTVEGDILIDCSLLPVLASKGTTAVRLANTTIKGRLWLKFRGYACLGSSIDLNEVVLDGSLIVRNYSFQRDFEAIIKGSYLEPNHVWMGVGICRSKIYGSCSVNRKGLNHETPAYVLDCKVLGMSELVIDHYRGFQNSTIANKGRMTSQEWEEEKKREILYRKGSRNSTIQAAYAERSLLTEWYSRAMHDWDGDNSPRVQEYVNRVRTNLSEQIGQERMSMTSPQIQDIPYIIRRVLDEEDRIVSGRPIDESVQEAIIGTSNWLRLPRTE